MMNTFAIWVHTISIKKLGHSNKSFGIKQGAKQTQHDDLVSFP